MKQIELNYLMVGNLPVDAHSFEINEELFYKATYGMLPNISRMRMLPPGNWQLVGKVSEISEGEAGEIVGEHNGLYEYPDFTINGLCRLTTALESLFSLTRSHGFEPSETVLLKLNK